ncbi:MAG: PQQ-binding-like beta-propeller repeat protein, partial [bacterium]
KLLRISPATGTETASMPLTKPSGTEIVLLRDISLAEIGEEQADVPGEVPAAAAGIQCLPLHEAWRLPCDNPELVWPVPGNGPADTFCVLSGRSILCIRTRPGFELVWQKHLRNRPDSVGFHAGLILATHGGTLTALDIADGATRWSTDLPFAADIICGNDQVVIAGQASTDGRIVQLDPGTGKIMWTRWFGQEIRFNGAKLNWLTLQKDHAGRSMLHLYWGRPALDKGSSLSEAIVDSKSGLVDEIRPFLPDEQEWPSFIAFGDNLRGPGNEGGVAPWSRQGPFLPDAVAYVGKGSLAHFLARTPSADLAPGWTQVMEVKPESQYLQSVSLHPTATGPYIRRVGDLTRFDTSSSTSIVYALPRDIPMRTAFNILDFRGDTGTVVVVSGARNAPDENGDYPYLWNGLQDCTGRGDVTLRCFNGQVQLGHSTRQLHEAGSNPVATLLNGAVKQHYMNSLITMSGISSLGWSKFDVLFYGFSGDASIAGGQAQHCVGADFSKLINRTTFVPGTNYLKFADLSGDAFTLNFSQCDFAAVEIVNTSQNAPKDKPEAIGINWTGGGPGLGPTDLVGADAPH